MWLCAWLYGVRVLRDEACGVLLMVQVAVVFVNFCVLSVWGQCADDAGDSCDCQYLLACPLDCLPACLTA